MTAKTATEIMELAKELHRVKFERSEGPLENHILNAAAEILAQISRRVVLEDKMKK
jgi:hypothetical protein